MTVTASADAALVDAADLQITVSAEGLDAQTVTVDYVSKQAIWVYEAETGGTPLASGAALSVEEGASKNYWVSLKKTPSADKTLTLKSAAPENLTAEVDPAADLSFGAGVAPTRRKITLSAVEEPDNGVSEEVEVTLADEISDGDAAETIADASDWTAAVTAADLTQALTLSPATVDLVRGEEQRFTVSTSQALTGEDTLLFVATRDPTDAVGGQLRIHNSAGAEDMGGILTVTLSADKPSETFTLTAVASGDPGSTDMVIFADDAVNATLTVNLSN